MTFSDHAPVCLTVLDERRNNDVNLRILDALIKDASLCPTIENIWNQFQDIAGTNVEKFLLLLYESREKLLEQAKLRFQSYGRKLKSLRASLGSLQSLQERMPNYEGVEVLLSQTRGEIQMHERMRADFFYFNATSSWIIVGDKVTKEFSKCTAKKFIRYPIQALLDDSGQLYKDATEICMIETRYYEHLLTAEPLSQQVMECRNQIWSHINEIVPPNMNRKLVVPFSSEELRTSLWALPKHSCPGEDSLSVTFFQEYWGIIGERFQLVCKENFETGHMPVPMAASLIYMIPKGDRQSADVSKWRPITLLNTVYKIYAKALSIRFLEVLPFIIHSAQTGFFKERSILGNIFTFWEAVAIAKKSNQELAILLLDFEKSYDCVEWSSLEGTLIKMGFSA